MLEFAVLLLSKNRRMAKEHGFALGGHRRVLRDNVERCGNVMSIAAGDLSHFIVRPSSRMDKRR